MRVLHVCRPAVGGIQRWLTEMLPRLEQAGFFIGLACPQALHQSLPDIKWRSWEVLDRPSKHDLVLSLRLLMEGRHYDLLHVHGLRCFGVCCMMPSENMILTLHNMPPAHLSRIKRKLLQRGLVRCRKVVCVSQAVKQAWLEMFPECEPICCVLPGGVPAEGKMNEGLRSELEARLVPKDGSPLLICVARLMPDKGVDILIQAISQIPELRLVVVGDGPDMASLRAMADEVAPGRVTFEGSQHQITEYLAIADLACVPSRREGQGLFPLEAMRAELPVVVSDSGGLPESVTDGLTGWVFQAGDVDDLVRVLYRALRHRDTWSAMGKVGKADVANRFGWEKLCSELAEIYRNSIRRRSIDS